MRRVRDTAGLSISSVVMAMFIITILVGTISTLTLGTIANSREVRDRTKHVSVIEAAGAKLEAALRSSRMYPGNRYATDLTIFEGQVLPLVIGNAAMEPFPDRPPSTTVRNYVRESTGGEEGEGYWRVEQILAPEPGYHRSVVALVRTFTGMRPNTGTQSGQEQLYRVEIANTPLALFQFMSEGELIFDGSVTLGGNVHANGSTESVAANTNLPAIRGSATCTAGQKVSTGSGTISGSFTNCRQAPRNRRFIELGNMDKQVKRLERYCNDGSGYVMCIGTPGENPTPAYEVWLNGNEFWCSRDNVSDGTLFPPTWQWNRTACPGHQSIIPSAVDRTNPGQVYILYGNVRISGGTNGRVTVIAWNRNPKAAAQFHILADTAANEGPPSALGLVAEGDIELGGGVADRGCPLNNLTGAFAAGGRMRISGQYINVSGDESTPCGAMTVKGSIAGRNGPVLSVSGPTGQAGWASRTYAFDPRLTHTPPPGFPEAYKWHVTSIRRVSPECSGLPIADELQREAIRDCE